MVKIKPMKRKVLLLSKIFGMAVFYSLVFIASIFLTMSILIKGEEIGAPNLIGKSLNEAYKITAEKGILLKKVVGNYDRNFKPHTIIDQFPGPGTRVKEKSFIKVYITAEQKEVIVPDLTGHHVRECEKILFDSELKKRFVSYIDADDVPVDFVISQSHAPDARIAAGSSIDLLVSNGKKENPYIMPDIIGHQAEEVVFFFEKLGFKIAKITRVSYSGLRAGIVINQIPAPGFRITPKNLISIQVSQ